MMKVKERIFTRFESNRIFKRILSSIYRHRCDNDLESKSERSNEKKIKKHDLETY